MDINRRKFLASSPVVGAVIGSLALDGHTDAGTSHEYRHDGAGWRKLREGLEFSRIDVYSNGENVDTFAVIRADPNYSRFRVAYDGKGRRTIRSWLDHLGADAVFNLGYYGSESFYSTKPSTPVISDGVLVGPARNRHSEGMFVAEPKSGAHPKAGMFDLAHEKVDYSQWEQGVQSWPMLIRRGRPRKRIGDGKDYRTAVGLDRRGNIVAVTTENNYFSLTEFSKALADTGMDLYYAMNLDGGHAAQMAVRSGNMDYATYGREQVFGNPLLDAIAGKVNIPIPGVIGIFER